MVEVAYSLHTINNCNASTSCAWAPTLPSSYILCSQIRDGLGQCWHQSVHEHRSTSSTSQALLPPGLCHRRSTAEGHGLWNVGSTIMHSTCLLTQNTHIWEVFIKTACCHSTRPEGVSSSRNWKCRMVQIEHMWVQNDNFNALCVLLINSPTVYSYRYICSLLNEPSCMTYYPSRIPHNSLSVPSHSFF